MKKHPILYRLFNDLVMEDPRAAAFVTELDRKVQELKEQFTKSILAIFGSQHGKDGELTFPSFEIKNGNILVRDSREFRVKSYQKNVLRLQFHFTLSYGRYV